MQLGGKKEVKRFMRMQIHTHFPPGSDASVHGVRSLSLLMTRMHKLGSDHDACRPVRRGSGDDKKPTKSCTIPGCPNRRGPRGYCASHSHSTHLNAESAKRATRKLERAKLSRLTFKPGDRIKEMKDRCAHTHMTRAAALYGLTKYPHSKRCQTDHVHLCG